MQMEKVLTVVDFVKIARNYRLFLILIGIQILLSVIRLFVGGTASVVLICLSLCAAGASIYGVVVLMRAMRYDTRMILLFSLLMFLPFISLVIMLYLNYQASSLLKKNGYRVGLFGVDFAQFPKIASGFDKGDTFRCFCPSCNSRYEVEEEGAYQCIKCNEEFIFIPKSNQFRKNQRDGGSSYAPLYWCGIAVGVIVLLVAVCCVYGTSSYEDSHNRYLSYKKEANELYNEICKTEADLRKAHKMLRDGSNINDFVLLLSAAVAADSNVRFKKNPLETYGEVHSKIEEAKYYIQKQETELNEKRKRLDRLNDRIESMKYEYGFED